MTERWRRRIAKKARVETIMLRVYRRCALRLQGFACFYCWTPLGFGDCTADHKHPRALGGQTVLENIAASCERCNTLKGDMPLADFMALISTRPAFGAEMVWWDIWFSRALAPRTRAAVAAIERLAGLEARAA